MKKMLSLCVIFMCLVLGFSGCTGDTVKYLPELSIKKSDASLVNDISGDTNLANTIKYSAEVNDEADAYYADAARTVYKMVNRDVVLTHSLIAKGNSASLYDKNGNVYIADSFNAYYTEGNKVFESDNSPSEGRVNTIRLGEYYFECHIRDFAFSKDEKVKLDKTFHLYGDRLYAQFTLLTSEATADIKAFGGEVRIPVDTVAAVQVRDANGISNNIQTAADTVEYVAFDIKNAGVAGFIAPSDGSVESVTVCEDNGFYVVNFVSSYNSSDGLNDINGEGNYKNNSITFGYRIYTDTTHSFEGIEREAYLERNPLTNISVNGGNAEGRFLGYDSLSGAYLFSIKGTDFNYAYQNPELQYSMPVSLQNDSNNRKIYIRSMGDNGCLEAAALLDDTNTLVPVNVQVCKNFCGDGGEPYYSVADTQYGDSIFPVAISADEKLSFTLLNLYQNWGKYPLKQLSSIEFHVSYYHLSTGTTESNCIAPYFVFGKDGWTLPDFRTASGNMWSTQPQFNSEGILKFMTYRDGKNDVYSEYAYGDIASVGQTYSDITNTYISDCGRYKYSLRHVEFPQTDENRTYYTLSVEFLEDASFRNFRRDFDLFYFDGRMVTFDNASFINAEGNTEYVSVNNDKSAEYYVLGSDSPCWGFYNISEEYESKIDEGFGTNFAMIIRESSIIINGQQSDISFVFRDSSDKGITKGALTLDAEKLSFSKGDTIEIMLVLLPWGVGTEETDANVIAVRNDSALNPVTVTASKGIVIEDSVIPVVRCEENSAEFTISGGKGNIAVRVDGFTQLRCPEIYLINGDSEEKVELASSNGYDGYSVYYNQDGTYSFSFVYTVEDADTEYKFRISQ